MPWYSGAKCNRLVQWIFKKKETAFPPHVAEPQLKEAADQSDASAGSEKESRKGKSCLEPILESAAPVSKSAGATVVVTSPSGGSGYPRGGSACTRLAIVKPVTREDSEQQQPQQTGATYTANATTQCDLSYHSGASSRALSPSSNATSPNNCAALCPLHPGSVGCACAGRSASPLLGGTSRHQLFLQNKRRASLQAPIMEHTSAREPHKLMGTSGSIPEQCEGGPEEDVFQPMLRPTSSHVSADVSRMNEVKDPTNNNLLFI